jgi:D-3-phosphoglycerate dehydrogenase
LTRINKKIKGEHNMTKIKTIDKIAKCGLVHADPAKYNISNDHTDPAAILLRSTQIHDMEIPSSLLAIARAGAGTNNIPIPKMTEKGIVVFNTPGANAMGVAELVIMGLLMSSRKVVDGIAWAQGLSGDDVAAQVEKGKSQFAGPEIHGKTLGVVGLGAIGALVANMAVDMGMNVIGYDPFLSVEGAWKLSRKVKHTASLNDIYKECDYISLHVPANDKTKGMINDAVLATTKKGMRLLNFSRAELVDNKSIVKATEDGTVACYVTDFPVQALLNKKGIIPIPHLGASTPESEDNCACMAVKQIINYIEHGSIINSVNFPHCPLSRPSDKRVCIVHNNVPHTISQIAAVFGNLDVNIEETTNKSSGNVAYTVMDVKHVPVGLADKIREISDVISVRVIG